MTEPIKHQGWRWDEVKDRKHWEIPDGYVMNLIYELGPDPEKKVYDLGCGIGRHTIYFASHGYQVYASDISQDSIDSTREWLQRENLTAELKQGHFLDVDYPENFFDLVVSMNVLNHGVKSEVYQIMQKVLKMLKPGGIFRGTIRIKDKDTPFYSKDIKKIDEQTLMMTTGEERGIPHFFAYLEEVPEIFKGFEMGYGAFVYVKIFTSPFTAENLTTQLGIEGLRFSLSKPSLEKDIKSVQNDRNFLRAQL